VAGEEAPGTPGNLAAAAPAETPVPTASATAGEPDKVSIALAIIGLLVVIGMATMVAMMKVD